MDYLAQKGRIFDIQRYSIHDGPGIRTVVFFKGCLFHCAWCCNPESQSKEFETMCQKNGTCKTVGEDKTVGEILNVVLKDLPYYKRSGGGLTLSGGEFLLQPDFAFALLSAAKEKGLHTAVETTACVPLPIIEKLLPVIDLVLMDVKHTDENKHKAFCGYPNTLMLENASKIANLAKKLIVRVPVIPTFNDREQDIRQIAKFAASLPKVEEMHLLPYHRLGMDKYAALGRNYALSDILPPTDAKMNALLSVARESGLKCQIGG